MPMHDDEDDRPASSRGSHEDNENENDFREPGLPRSLLGIVSCALAVLAVLTSAFARWSELVAALVVLGAGVLCLTGAALAIAALLLRGHNKLLAVVGLCLNTLLLCCGLGLIIGPLLTG
jgi:hypothetical protein